jgi:predicted nucleic acid-binding Zn ribbon protein
MDCMWCGERIPMSRRAFKSWFCSSAHYHSGLGAGVMETAYRTAQTPNRDPRGNPANSMSCLVCGMAIGLENRLRGRWYCTDACLEVMGHAEGSRAGSSVSRRDAIALLTAGLLGGAVWVNRGSLPRPKIAPINAPEAWTPAWISSFLHGEHHLGFGDQSALRQQWQAAGDAWKLGAEGIWQPLRSMTTRMVSSFPAGTLEFTTRGGVGFLFRAATSLSSYHSVSFRPVRNRAGMIIDYRLERANWRENQTTAEWKKVMLNAGANAAGGDQDTFRVFKRGDYFEACMAAAGGGWNIVANWYEKSLAEGAVGLFVAQGHRYGIVSGRISS